MAKFTCGGKVTELPILTFKQLKLVYPIISNMRNLQEETAEDVALRPIDESIKIIAIALEKSDNPMSAEQIEEELLAPEMKLIEATIQDIMVDNELVPKPGEDNPAEEKASLSTGTSTQSSAKSSPASRRSTGKP